MVMTFTKEQTEQLNQPIDPKVVAFRQQGSMQLAYLSWYVINEANRIFGFDGWQSETVQLDCVQSDDFCVTYIAKVRVTIGDVIREGVGAGHGKGKSVNLGDKHESAVKEAESDARKRAFHAVWFSVWFISYMTALKLGRILKKTGLLFLPKTFQLLPKTQS